MGALPSQGVGIGQAGLMSQHPMTPLSAGGATAKGMSLEVFDMGQGRCYGAAWTFLYPAFKLIRLVVFFAKVLFLFFIF